MRIETISQTEQFKNLREQWDSLFDENKANSVYLSWEWLFTWWEVYADSKRTLNIICVKDEKDRLLAIAPLMVTVKHTIPFLKRRILEFLGTGEDQKDEVCSNYLGFIVAKDSENICQLLNEELVRGIAERRWDEIWLASVPVESFKAIARCPEDRLILSHNSMTSCAIIVLPKSWEIYLSSLKRNWRYQIKKGREELKHKGVVECVAITALPEIHEAFREFVNLHQKRWTTSGMPGAFASEKFSRFHDKILERFSAKGWVGIRLLKVNGRTMAASYRFFYNQTVYFYQAGYDSTIPSKIGLGMLERSFDIEEAIKTGFRRYDFYKAKDGSYKWHFAKDRRDVTDVRITKKDAIYQMERAMSLLGTIKRKTRKTLKCFVKIEGRR